jgi:hypothetical protein
MIAEASGGVGILGAFVGSMNTPRPGGFSTQSGIILDKSV